MIVQRIRAELLSIPELSAWPEIAGLIERPVENGGIPCWEHPDLACRAVGGDTERALPGAAAIFCLLYSIHLVDDLLDCDPQGLQHIYGEGRVANYAAVFQAAASVVVERADLELSVRGKIHEELARAALGTAFGQNLDLEELRGEEDYWRVVEAKTPPLFGGALAIGGLLGGASRETIEGLRQLGFLLGKMIQIGDDVKDAFEVPAAPDWSRRYNNLAILYALTAEHPERSSFVDLLARIDDRAALEAAQGILVRSGAVGFCAYHMLTLHREAQATLGETSLVNPRPLERLIKHYIKPLASLLGRIGVECPEELLDVE